MKCKACGQESSPHDKRNSHWAPVFIDGSELCKIATEEPCDFGNSSFTKEHDGELYVCLDCGTVRIKSYGLYTD